MFFKDLVVLLPIIFGATGSYVAPNFEYHNYESLTSYLENVAENFPEYAHLYSIGTSVEGE